MSDLTVQAGAPLKGLTAVPGDKSISHRALLLGALANGSVRITGFLPAVDCWASVGCLRGLGVEIDELDSTTLVVHGRGLTSLRPPAHPLHCNGSGTTMRLLSGILAGQPFESVLTGNEQLSGRPMSRVTIPLRKMGARVDDSAGYPPLVIHGGPLQGLDYTLPVASAQVKSALLLAGLYAGSPTTVREPVPARDHTERMLEAMGAQLTVDGPAITMHPGRPLQARDVDVPGDISSAAFLMAAALLIPGAALTLAGVGVNPTRSGVLDVLQAMGGDIRLDRAMDSGGEPVADITVRYGALQGASIGGDLIPRLIDELPLLALVATQAQGTTAIRDAAELRVKETDRIATTTSELRKLGAQIEARPGGFLVQGPSPLRGADVCSHGDHRLAMTLAVAGLLAEGETLVRDSDCIDDSFPGFAGLLRGLGANIR